MMSFPGTPVQRADQPRLLLNQRPIAGIFIVTPDYFAVLQIPLRRGRTFTEHDREETQRVAVIDENLARLLWPSYPAGPNPLGQRMLIGGVNKEPAEIVGIIGIPTKTWKVWAGIEAFTFLSAIHQCPPLCLRCASEATR